MNRSPVRPAVGAVLALVLSGCISIDGNRAAVAPAPMPAATPAPAGDYDVRSFGAIGDGKAIDSPAINRAIEAAAAAGGGTVRFPAGTYASYSIHLKSNVSLYLGAGCTILAAEPPADLTTGYDAAEANSPADQYEDFGHSHWHNSLIWGEHLENIMISGPGRIYGYGLSRGGGLRSDTPEERMAGIKGPPLAHPVDTSSMVKGKFGEPGRDTLPAGVGDKAIGLRECHNITIRDVAIYHGGHFGILATGVDNLTLENLKIDTNRDGMDIDSCRNVHVSDCSVNSPFDDGICLKADYGLGRNRACENMTITNCHVSGYDEGTYLAGTFERKYNRYSAASGPTGRIKFGTEGNGGFKNVAISNCTFDYCRGLAIEEVDGGSLEDITIDNLTMRDVPNSAIYIRLGARNRGPEGTETGVLRRVTISNIVASNVAARFSSIISGVPGHPIEGLTLSNIRILYSGGGTAADAAIEPPEVETAYPEPNRHGTMPAYGFFIRHAKDVSMHGIDLSTAAPDARPAFVIEQSSDLEFDHVKAAHADGVPTFVLRKVDGFDVHASPGVPDTHKDKVEGEEKL